MRSATAALSFVIDHALRASAAAAATAVAASAEAAAEAAVAAAASASAADATDAELSRPSSAIGAGSTPGLAAAAATSDAAETAAEGAESAASPSRSSGKGGKGGEGGQPLAVLSGTAFERVRTGNQWFDSLALTVGGKEVFNVSVAKVARGSLRVVVDGALQNPSDVDTFTSADRSTTMVSSIMSRRFKIGHKSAQTLQVTTLGGVGFTILSAKAAKYDGERGQFDYRHLNVKLDSGMPAGATGIFAELSGAAPITAATKQLLADPAAFDLAMTRAQAHGKSIEISGEN